MKTMIQKNYKRNIIFLSLLIFLISLTQTAIVIKHQEITDIYGFNYFIAGSIAIIGGGIQEWIVWLANPFSFLSIILFLKDSKTAILSSSIALILSASFLNWKEILGSESGTLAQILSFGLGYYLWLSSILLLTIGIIYYYSNKNSVKI